MNAQGLIAEVAGILVDGSGFTDAEILAKLNDAQLAIAEKVFLPDLADGTANITATTGAMYANLPATYHKNIFLAKNTTTAAVVEVFDNIGVMARMLGEYPEITNEGDATAITIHASRVLYQRVPTSSQTIALMFYRLPVAMTDASNSYPDGLSGSRTANQEAFDRALVHHAAWKFFEKIEQGMEGRKVDTDYHKGEFTSAMMNLENVCRTEKVLPRPAANRCW